MPGLRRGAVRTLVAALTLLAPASSAQPMQLYATNPVEHDDQGRSDEPDFLVTGVFGPRLENRVLDLDRDGIAAPDSALPPPSPGQARVVAPGCTDDIGRQPSGLCGLWSIGAGVLAPGDLVPPYELTFPPQACRPPGAYTPRCATVIGLLDVRFDAAGGAYGLAYARVDWNHKLTDSGARALLGLRPEPVLAGPVSIWAWRGDWHDRNSNGVIDHLGDREGNVDERNEFVWRGTCAPPPGVGRYCVSDPPGRPHLLMFGFAYPGERHPEPRWCVGALVACAYPPVGDPPGVEPLCWVGVAVHCFSWDFYHPEDPLFGPQDSIAWDDWFDDATSEPDIAARGVVYGQLASHSPTWYYDTSVLVHHVFVAAYRAPFDPTSPNRARLTEAAFLDVDRFEALHPELDALLQATVKPAARGAWLVLRDLVEV